jgi:hypothetical protein
MNLENNINDDKDINISELVRILFLNKLWVISITLIFVVSSFIYAQTLTHKYASSVVAVPADNSSDINNLASQYGGLASLAGVSLPTGSVDKSDIAIEVLKSRLFTTNFIERHNILVPMMAAKSWDLELNKIVIDQTIYNEKNDKWIRSVSPPKESRPSLNEAYDFWKKNIFSVYKDQANGLVTIKITHYSPHEAKKWADLLFEDLNNYLRNQDVEEADLSIKYLYQEVNKIESKDLKDVFYSLIESQTKTKMLAYARKDYRFKIIDPPIVSEKRASPNKIRIVVSSSIIGFFLGILVVFLRRFKI